MKKLLVILGILFSFGASAQTMVYDTTIVKAPLTVITTGAKDSLALPPATTLQNGYMTAVAMQQLTLLAAGSTVYPAVNVQTGTSYTIQTSDFNKMISMTNTGATTVTLPINSASGFTCRVMQSGGTITIVGASGVTIRSPFGYKRSQTQYGVIVITCLGNGVYSLTGNLKT